jgi:DNA-binding Lrp family transcriptional regulator
MDVSRVEAGTPPLSSTLSRGVHLSLSFLLDTIALSRAGRDIVDAALLAAIVQANVAPINQEPTLQLAYATLDAVAPDELRRPVSINAIAEMLGMPFETVRRRVGRLARSGACVITRRGVLVPEAALATPEYKALVLARYQRLQRFYFDLVAAGALLPLPPSTEARQPGGWSSMGEPPVRAVDRLLGDYVMRLIEGIMRRMGSPLTGLVFMEMGRANTEHLALSEPEAAIPVADSDRRPVPIARLAERLNIPTETLRRRVAFLEREGFCRRTRDGFAVLSAGLARLDQESLISENAANIQGLFARLDRLGVLAVWNGQALADETHAVRT